MNFKFKQAIIIIIILIGIEMILGSIPIPTLLNYLLIFPIIGYFIKSKKITLSLFFMGMTSGFIVWAGANYYFDLNNGGIMLARMANLLFVPKTVIIILSGVIGGILSGISLNLGKLVYLFTEKLKTHK